jgi:hypothetical protein
MNRLKKAALAVTMLLGLLLASLPSHAMMLVVNGPQMQTMMAGFFPHTQQFASWQVVLSEPVPEFFAAKQAVALAVNMRVSEGGRLANAWGKISGQLAYNPNNQQLQLIKPKLVEFDVKDGDKELGKQLRTHLGAQIGQSLPIIVLFDVKQMGGAASWIKPNSVKVVSDGIAIDF